MRKQSCGLKDESVEFDTKNREEEENGKKEKKSLARNTLSAAPLLSRVWDHFWALSDDGMKQLLARK